MSRQLVSRSTVTWSFDAGGTAFAGRWQRYAPRDEQTIERALREGRDEVTIQPRRDGIAMRETYRITLNPDEGFTQENLRTGCIRAVRRTGPTEPPSSSEVYMHVSTQESTSPEGRYQVHHQVHMTGANREELQGVRSVKYSVPGQGFRSDYLVKSQRPFSVRYGPCWGRPHVTVDITFEDGRILEGVFSDNLPSADRSFRLAGPRTERAQPGREAVRRRPQQQQREAVPEGRQPNLQQHEAPVAAARNNGTVATAPALPPLEHELSPEDVPEYLVCSIAYQVFRDPVILMDGHTYEREAIDKWLEHHDTSPMTNAPLPCKAMVPNIALRQQISAMTEA